VSPPHKPRRRWLVAIVAVGVALLGLYGTRGAWGPYVANLVDDLGDLGGIAFCDASAAWEGRLTVERRGCMMPIPGRVLTVAGASADAALPEDTFIMGAQADDPDAPGYDPEADEDEGPPHRVRLRPFRMHRYEVTVVQFRWCVWLGACKGEDVDQSGGYFNYGQPNRDRHPVNGVTWFGARDYCAWIGGRLPTEAEWEFAARGGRLGLRFPWASEPAPTCTHAVMAGGAGGRCPTDSTSEVDALAPDGQNRVFWIEHMAGNVWEWTADWYAADWYARSPGDNPTGPATGTGRVQRGGGWTDEDPFTLRTTFRAQMDPTMKLADIGFRCVADAPEGR
jgi:formylglycine-generating enzyme required for sulfatase activity